MPTELSWPHTQDIIVQVAQALCCLHDSEPPLAHGDLKLENILLDKVCQLFYLFLTIYFNIVYSRCYY
uniref:Protein kinase domain-containing protein n=1 Tax=Rhizophora mucronata TaxID=61149 RepID=A0A2P2J5I1_RHIMU